MNKGECGEVERQDRLVLFQHENAAGLFTTVSAFFGTPKRGWGVVRAKSTRPGQHPYCVLSVFFLISFKNKMGQDGLVLVMQMNHGTVHDGGT